jgi:hypothetical protein
MPNFNEVESRGRVRHGSQEGFRPERGAQGEVDHRVPEAAGSVRRVDGSGEEGWARPFGLDSGSARRPADQAEKVADLRGKVDLEHKHVDARIFARYALGMNTANGAATLSDGGSTGSPRPTGRMPLARKCQSCGCEFMARAADVAKGWAKYCGRTCATVAKSKGVPLVCSTCGNSFIAKRSEVRRSNVRFCSRACFASATSFWAHVDKGGPIPPHVPHLGPCWVWLRGRTAKGYGQLDFGGKTVKANRYSFFLEHGRWPEPQCLHRCDNRACVRPSHLFEGTNDDNVQDKVSKGRQAVQRGEASPRAKLNDAKVIQIRALRAAGEEIQAISAAIGVSHFCVEDVLYGRTWRHVV